jgi:hypothetical protein
MVPHRELQQDAHGPEGDDAPGAMLIVQGGDVVVISPVRNEQSGHNDVVARNSATRFLQQCLNGETKSTGMQRKS